MPSRSPTQIQQLLSIRFYIDPSLILYTIPSSFPGVGSRIIPLTSDAERRALTNNLARQFQIEYERVILSAVRQKTPRITGDLRKSMKVKRGRGYGRLIDVEALRYQRSVRVGRSRSVNTALIKREGNGRLQQALENALVRAWVVSIQQDLGG
ncbi:MAG: hypothetical protein OXR67_08470 [Chloroflexota bacterium]|nr:hypothetical protein [Chloroflexota bacterium]